MECPLWNVVAGYYVEHVYMGGFGTILTAFTKSFEAAAAQAFTCTLCGKCEELCPMEVDVPEMIRRLRRKIVERKIAVPHERIMANVLKTFNPYGEPPEKRMEWMKG
jgi:L-lactate utilization protein LutB